MARPTPFPTLFQPGYIGKLRIRNRILMAPITTLYGADNGDMTEITLHYYAERARGGVGMIVTEAVCVDSPEGRQFATIPCLDREGLIPSHNQVVEAVHSYGARIALQLHHAGRLADSRIMRPGQVPVGPSKIVSTTSWRQIAEPRELSVDEIRRIVEKYGEAADRGKRAGYDAIELHFAHGYLPHSFMAERTNQRTDDYGGSREKRTRFPVEVIRKVKEAVGNGFPVICQFSAEGGYDFNDGLFFAKAFEEAGADALHVSIGGVGPISVIPRDQSHMARPQGYLVPFAEAVKKQSRVPVIAVGEIKEPEFAEQVLAAGKADFVAVGRGLITDPEWPLKAAQGRTDEIRKCPSCGLCEMSWVVGVHMRCLANADVGREREFVPLRPAEVKKRVVVLGGDVAGLEAARVAALQGHQVSLYDSHRELGAVQLKSAAAAPQKERMSYVREYLVGQMEKVGVAVHLGKKLDAAAIEKLRPDAVIVATARLPRPAISGSGRAVLAQDVLVGKARPNGKAVVWGRGIVACETAECLAARGVQVTLATPHTSAAFLDGALRSAVLPLLSRLKKYNVEVLEEHQVKEASNRGVVVQGPGGAERLLEGYTLVVAAEPVLDEELARRLEGKVPQVFTVGDYSEPWGIAHSIFQGAQVARRI